ncbi:hypothetical protein [Lunatibacter salilacus]|uniref:hypothetical protein n=1 Tax=Lunatibacter salilacus TaxID=2483804 RepID=UPI00131E6395|nr:hypothetical protein [Lunatibacter salilacus]
MKLVVYCKKCNSKNNLSEKARDRHILSQIIGENFKLKCTNCSEVRSYSVNEVHAEQGILLVFLFLLILSITIMSLVFLKDYFSINTWWLIPGLIAIPTSFYAGVSNAENKKIKSFNRFKIKI